MIVAKEFSMVTDDDMGSKHLAVAESTRALILEKGSSTQLPLEELKVESIQGWLSSEKPVPLAKWVNSKWSALSMS